MPKSEGSVVVGGGANILCLLRYSALEFSNFQAFERKAGENESLEEVITCGKHHF